MMLNIAENNIGSARYNSRVRKAYRLVMADYIRKVKVEVPKTDLRESLIAIQETEIQNLKDEIESLKKALQPKEKPEPIIHEPEPELLPEAKPEPVQTKPEQKPEVVPEENLSL